MFDSCLKRVANSPFDSYLKRGYVVTYTIDRNNRRFIFRVSKDRKYASDTISYYTMKNLGSLLDLTVHTMIERLISEIERMV